MSKDKKSDRPVLAVSKRNLAVSKRKVLGRKVKALRTEGVLPANIYGKKTKSLSVQGNLGEIKKTFSQVGETGLVDLQVEGEKELGEIKKTFSQVGETGLVDLQVEGEKEVRPVLFSNPQTDPVSDQLLHLDFYQVDLTQKVSADIPVEISGKSPAVERSEGVLVQILNEIEVEALPTDLPEKLVVDVSSLDKVNKAINVKQALKDSGWDLGKIESKVSADQLISKVEPPTKEEEKPVVVEEEVEGEEGAEGETKEEGKEAPTEGGKEEAKEEEKKDSKKDSKEKAKN